MTNLLPRYNLAFIPTNPANTNLFYGAAQPYQDIANGYCLASKTALAHVTLCQFRATSDEEAQKAVQLYIGRSLALQISAPYARAGSGKHKDSLWIGYDIERTRPLKALYDQVYQHLQQEGFEIKTTQDRAQNPHFTIARTPLSDEIKMLSMDCLKGIEVIGCTLQLGRSDELGQLTEILPPPKPKQPSSTIYPPV